MYPDKQNKNQQLNKVQGVYRKKRRELKTEVKEYKVGTIGSIVVIICLIVFLIFFIMSMLFDMGVSVPEIFGR
ncbi:MAG: hypothetical protein ACQET6_11455 [Bacillota bacterium]|uniref:hypothetical protein n=1 Tax=Rossellomorea sp. FM04394 TaxID=3243076 RepID=UPI0035A5CBE8